jgi:signal transduction histidine kinase
MLSEFVTSNRSEIIARCRARVAKRMAPRPTEQELVHGIPLFLDQLIAGLRSKLDHGAAVGVTATKHGGDLLHMGFTIAQVVHDYGDACQSITELAIEQSAPITTDEFQALNLCLDNAIAGAVTEFHRQREVDVVSAGERKATEDLGYFAHELRNLIATATLGFEALKDGSVGTGGSTGAIVSRSLMRLRDLVDRSLSVVRLKAGIGSRDQIVIGELLEEVEASAMMEAKAHGHQLTVETDNASAVVEADRQILASIIANIVQNAYKYTRAYSHVTLRTRTTDTHVRIEVEDECGGLPPGKVETLFDAYEQRSADHSGLGLGLAICARGAQAIGATLHVRDLPKKGCVFAVELPRVSAIS